MTRRDRNVLGAPLGDCSHASVTGFFRDGCCRTGPQDRGLHVVCVEMTQRFLEFSRAAGNDLSTPRPEYDFSGLKPGDRWCLCAERWREAYLADAAPRVVLASTEESALSVVTLEQLKAHALDAKPN